MLTKVHGAADDGYAQVFGPPDRREVGFGYINNRMGGLGDRRATLLVAALRSCLDG